MITKKYTSCDKKITIKAYFSDSNLWISEEDIATFFHTNLEEIKDKIELLENNKSSKKNVILKNSGKEPITCTCYDFDIIKGLNKHYQSIYYKDFRKWYKSVLRACMFNTALLSQTFKVLNKKIVSPYIIFISIAIILSLAYFFINLHNKEIIDIGLTLFGINFVIITLNIPTVVSLTRDNNKKIKKLLKKRKRVKPLVCSSHFQRHQNIIN